MKTESCGSALLPAHFELLKLASQAQAVSSGLADFALPDLQHGSGDPFTTWIHMEVRQLVFEHKGHFVEGSLPSACSLACPTYWTSSNSTGVSQASAVLFPVEALARFCEPNLPCRLNSKSPSPSCQRDLQLLSLRLISSIRWLLLWFRVFLGS